MVNRCTCPGLCDGLIGTLSSGKTSVSQGWQCLPCFQEMRHIIYQIPIYRSKIQYFHSITSVIILLRFKFQKLFSLILYPDIPIHARICSFEFWKQRHFFMKLNTYILPARNHPIYGILKNTKIRSSQQYSIVILFCRIPFRPYDWFQEKLNLSSQDI